jgi:regulator of RNase E activity RraA
MPADPPAQRGLTGLVDPGRVHPLTERVAEEEIARLSAIDDLSATVSDVLDMLGLEGAVGASELRPTIAGRKIVGTAVTVRKVPQRRAGALDAARGEADMGEIEGANQCQPGDVIVIEGLPGVSAMGGLMSEMAKREGATGAIIDGGYRDVGHGRSIGFPVWSSDVTPVTGKWRSEVAEVGGSVTIAGLAVSAGDLAIADETGVVFVPRDAIGEVVERVEAISQAEAAYAGALASDVPLDELIRAHRQGAPPANEGVANR